ncbi:hypothetical protein EDD18DRAFT_1170058 [Armillaria luteobubalina]|uniref:Uncharacterized protein n=1 Tax=Armillaria luteobubalina TaxID=153913 RepID=A0AA39UML7_9AGAR|nr:hypothetical protein EDD18DRAFT_1170058 [Armillaria luteobubalina]
MSRVQSYVFWSTSQARQLVRSVLTKEPKIGMHHQQLFNEIIKQYPDEKLPTHLVPDTLPSPPARGGAYARTTPVLAEHPVRSMRYLKKVILEDMLRLREVEKVIVTRDREEKRTKTKALFVKHPEPVSPTEMYRWRVVPGSAPTHDVPDPDPEEMFEAKRVEAWKKKVHEKNKMLPPGQKLSTRHPPPPKRILWLREREWKDKGLDDFSRDQGSPLSSAYQRSMAPRRPDEEHDTEHSSAPQTEEQDLYDVNDDPTPYRRPNDPRGGPLNHRRHFSLAANQTTLSTKTPSNLSIPPFPRFTQLDIREKEKNALEEEIEREETPSQDDGPQITFLERGLNSSVYVRPSKPRAPRKEPEPERDEIDTKLEDDPSHEPSPGAEIIFLEAEPYERSRRPRRPRKEPEPERWERDLPEDILPPPIDTRPDPPQPVADLKMSMSATVGIRHSRASQLYETLVKKSLSGPYAVPRLINVPASRPAYNRSTVRREPVKESEESKDDIDE